MSCSPQKSFRMSKRSENLRANFFVIRGAFVQFIHQEVQVTQNHTFGTNLYLDDAKFHGMGLYRIHLEDSRRTEGVEALALLGPVVCKPGNEIIINAYQLKKLDELGIQYKPSGTRRK